MAIGRRSNGRAVVEAAAFDAEAEALVLAADVAATGWETDDIPVADAPEIIRQPQERKWVLKTHWQRTRRSAK